MQPKLKTCSVCEKEKILWKSIPPTCKECYYKHIHTYALNNGKNIKVFKIRPISKKRAGQMSQYRINRDKYLKEHPICEYPGCNSTKVTLHHKKGRIGALLSDVRYFCSLCHLHHRFAEENPIQAKKIGISEDRLMDKESIIPLQNIDCNCNNCIYFIRDVEKTKEKNKNDQIVAAKIHYGNCTKFNKQVGEIANICLLHTQDCFKNRREL